MKRKYVILLIGICTVLSAVMSILFHYKWDQDFWANMCQSVFTGFFVSLLFEIMSGRKNATRYLLNEAHSLFLTVFTEILDYYSLCQDIATEVPNYDKAYKIAYQGFSITTALLSFTSNPYSERALNEINTSENIVLMQKHFELILDALRDTVTDNTMLSGTIEVLLQDFNRIKNIYSVLNCEIRYIDDKTKELNSSIL